MRFSTRTSRTFLGLGLLAASAIGLGACGPDYALFKVHIQFQSKPQAAALTRTDLDKIAYCQISIDDDAGKAVLENYPLKASTTNGSLHGCESSLTPADIGYFSYSTSRTSGSLKFTETSFDLSDTPLERGSASGTVKSWPPEVPVEIVATPL